MSIMLRIQNTRVLLFCSVFLSGVPLQTAELQKMPAVGQGFSGRIGLKESQEFIGHWSREPRFSRRFELGAEIAWKVLQVREAEILLEGRVLAGHYRHALAGFIELEEVYGLILDDLVFQVRFGRRECRVQPERKSLQRLVNRFEKGQANRRLPEGIRKQIVAAFLDRLQLAHWSAFWPILNSSLRGPEKVEFFSRRLASRAEKPSGTLSFSICPWSSRSFAGGKGREVLLRRSHFPTSGGGRRSSGYGTYAWASGASGPPYRTLLRLSGDYLDEEELKGVVDFPQGYRQRHALEIFLGASGEEAPSGAQFTSLGPRLEQPMIAVDLLTSAEHRELLRIARKAERGQEELIEAVSDYARQERGAGGGKPFAAAVHFTLCELLARSLPAERGPLVDFTERVIQRGRSLPEYLVVLRAVASPRAGFTDAERLEFFRVALARREYRFSRWGGMLLSQGRWKGTVDLLLEALARKADAAGVGGAPGRKVNLELNLQRLTGSPVAGLPAARIRALAADREGRAASRSFSMILPGDKAKGFYYTEAGAGAVFLFDASRPYERDSLTRKRGSRRPLIERTRLAYLALREALEKPPVELRFALALFHSTALLRSGWAPGTAPSWRKDTLDFVASELSAGKNPRDESRARYGVGLKAVISGLPDAETVVLTTDFDRGDYWQLESRLLVWNYLRGARVITYGLREEGKADPAALSFLERLAWNHHGWFRFLD